MSLLILLQYTRIFLAINEMCWIGKIVFFTSVTDTRLDYCNLLQTKSIQGEEKKENKVHGI
jgi:hypothetical protein